MAWINQWKSESSIWTKVNMNSIVKYILDHTLILDKSDLKVHLKLYKMLWILFIQDNTEYMIEITPLREDHTSQDNGEPTYLVASTKGG